MADAVNQAKAKTNNVKTKKSGWFWPLGVAATSVAGVVLVALRGCWHRRMTWPVRMQNHSYQVCLECGVKRLFDEKRFCSYGPFRYDMSELIAWERSKQEESITQAAPKPASGILGSEIGSKRVLPDSTLPQILVRELLPR